MIIIDLVTVITVTKKSSTAVDDQNIFCRLEKLIK